MSKLKKKLKLNFHSYFFFLQVLDLMDEVCEEEDEDERNHSSNAQWVTLKSWRAFWLIIFFSLGAYAMVSKSRNGHFASQLGSGKILDPSKS